MVAFVALGLFAVVNSTLGEQKCTLDPGVSTASWDVTGVLAEGGVQIDERSESVLPLSAPQAMKILGSKAVLLDF
jgi:hypothetical protein